MIPRAVLFDLGGVVLEIDSGRTLAAWGRSSRLAPEALRGAFQIDEPYRRHEVGALADAGFFAHLRERLQLEADDAAVLDGWNAMLVGEIAPVLSMIEHLRAAGIGCHALSNTNAAHLARIEEAFPRFLARFDQVFLSHRIGHRKPGPEAFAHVLQALGLAAGEVLFLDDLEANVQGARVAGLRAEWVRSPAEVRAALARHGLPVPG